MNSSNVRLVGALDRTEGYDRVALDAVSLLTASTHSEYADRFDATVWYTVIKRNLPCLKYLSSNELAELRAAVEARPRLLYDEVAGRIVLPAPLVHLIEQRRKYNAHKRLAAAVKAGNIADKPEPGTIFTSFVVLGTTAIAIVVQYLLFNAATE